MYSLMPDANALDFVTMTEADSSIILMSDANARDFVTMTAADSSIERTCTSLMPDPRILHVWRRGWQRAHIRVQDATITIAGCVFVLMLREFQTTVTAGCVVVLILCAFQKAATAGYVFALMLGEFQTIPASLWARAPRWRYLRR